MKGGFTLIELLVVISIIFLLTSFFIISHREIKEDYVLENSAREVEKTIERVREMALSFKEIINPNNPTEKVIPAGGYGAQFESKKIIIFADCNSNGEYDSENVCGTSNQFSEMLEEVNIEPKTKILNLVSFLTFKPPHPTVLINNNPNATSVTIIIALENNLSKTKNIHVNKAGLIYVE